MKNIALLFVAGFVIYLPSIFNKFVWDDEQFIYRNIYVKEFNLGAILTENTIAGAGENSNYYRPLTTLTFAIDYLIWGLNPVGYHLVNITLHTLTAYLIYLLLTKLKFSPKLALIIGLIFLFHPIQTEAVTYVNSRGDSMYAFWGLISLNLWTIFISSDQKQNLTFNIGSKQYQVDRFWLPVMILATYILSLLSKEIALATLGLYFLIFIYLLLLKRTYFSLVKWPNLSILSGLSIIASCYLLLRATVLNFMNSFNFYDGANLYSQNILIRINTFVTVFWQYLGLLFWPHPLHMERQVMIASEYLTMTNLLFVGLIISLLYLGWYEYKTLKSANIYFGSLWYAIMIAPVSGIIPINGIMYEHWLYLPMVGFFMVLGALYNLTKVKYKVIEKILNEKRENYGLLIFLIIYSLLTIRQNYLWGDPIRFYEYTLQFSQSGRLYNNLGIAYADHNESQKAIENFDLALQYDPYHPATYHNYGGSLMALGQLQEAKQKYEKALELAPQFVPARINYLTVLFQLQEYELAKNHVNKLIQDFPDNLEFIIAKGQILWVLGEKTESEKVFNQALVMSRFDPKIKATIDQIKRLPQD